MCTRPHEKRLLWRGELLPDGIIPAQRVALPTPKLGGMGCLSPLGQEEKEGEMLCWTLLLVLGFCVMARLCSHFWMCVCFQEDRHGHGSSLKGRCSAEADFDIVAKLLGTSFPPFFLLKSKWLGALTRARQSVQAKDSMQWS